MNRLALILCLFFLTTSLSAQVRKSGLQMDDAGYNALPLQQTPKSSRLASRASLRPYAPLPQDQGSYNNCVGWAVAYGARTIMLAQQKGITNPRTIQQYAFSPSFTYKLISRSRSCNEAVSIEAALASMQDQGAAPLRQVPETCVNRLYSRDYASARPYRIGGYSRLFYRDAQARDKVQAVKYALAQGQPVIVGMRCTPSFETAENQSVWKRIEPLHTRQYFGHAVCVVAYDNNKYGGAFQVMNSWGRSWGKDGFIWIRYEDFAAFTKYGYAPHSINQSRQHMKAVPVGNHSPYRMFLPFLLLFRLPKKRSAKRQ
ncbi:MAG: C1 family peptidase [Bacteroidota bacterium]